jgi:hypothetical protein
MTVSNAAAAVFLDICAVRMESTSERMPGLTHNAFQQTCGKLIA